MTPQTAGELRRAARRLVQLGILRGFTEDDANHPRHYTFVTAAGDTTTLTRPQVHAYLHGLAQGSHVERATRDDQGVRVVRYLPPPA